MLKEVQNRFLPLYISLVLIILTSNLALASSIKEDYATARHKFYSDKVAEEEIINDLTGLQKNLSKKSDAESYYWQAQIEFLLGALKQRLEQKTAAKHFKQSQKLVQNSIAKEKTSYGYRLLGDTYGRLIEYNGVFYAIKNGNKIIDLLKKAVSLDPKNYSAYNSLGRAYFKAPNMVGGRLDKAIKNLKQALESQKQVENFISYYYLAQCYLEQGKTKETTNYLKEAANIYPNNRQVKLLSEKISKNKSN